MMRFELGSINLHNIEFWPRWLYFVIVLLASTLTAFMGYKSFLSEKIHEFQAETIKTEETEDQLISIKNSLNKLSDYQKEYQAKEKALSQYKNHLPVDHLLTDLTMLINFMHLKLIVLEPITNTEPSTKTQRIFHIILDGDFFKIMALLENLQNLLPLATLAEFSMTASNESLLPPKILRLDGQLTLYDLPKS